MKQSHPAAEGVVPAADGCALSLEASLGKAWWSLANLTTVADTVSGAPRLISTDALSNFRSTREGVDLHEHGATIDAITAAALRIEDA